MVWHGTGTWPAISSIQLRQDPGHVQHGLRRQILTGMTRHGVAYHGITSCGKVVGRQAGKQEGRCKGCVCRRVQQTRLWMTAGCGSVLML